MPTPTTLSLQSATVREDGYALRLTFTGPVPAAATMPDWLPGAQAGAALTATASGGPVAFANDAILGAYATEWELPIYVHFNEGGTTSGVPPGDYCVAYALYDATQGREIAWSEVAHYIVQGLTITSGGSGYTAAPTVTIAPPPAGGTQATATCTVSGGAVTGLTVTNAGSGYSVPPTFTFTGGGGTGAAAVASVINGAVTTTYKTSFAVPGLDNPGCGAQLAPNLSVNVYLSPTNGGPSSLTLYMAQVPMNSSAFSIPLTAAAPTSQVTPWSPGSPLTWTCQYKASRPITLGETLAVSAPAGLWQDSAGNATAAFTNVGVANHSLVDSTGFTSPALTPPDTVLGKQARFYVCGDPAYGSDSNPGTLAAPLLTYDRACKLLNAAFGTTPSWCGIALRRGDRFYPQLSTGPATVGIAPTMPTVVESYWHDYTNTGQPDPGTRPTIVLDCSEAMPGLFSPGTQQFVLIREVHVVDINGDQPGAFNFPFASYSPIAGLVLSDCVIEQTALGLNWTPVHGVGVVTGVTVGVGGSGYTSSPTVTFSGGNATAAAKGTATIAGGQVIGVTITNPGAGYTAVPTVAFSGGGGTGAAGTAQVGVGVVLGVGVTGGGSGYTSAPTVGFSGGGGTAAAGTATVAGGQVTGVTMTAFGSGYTAPPVVSFTGGGGTGATAVAQVLPTGDPFGGYMRNPVLHRTAVLNSTSIGLLSDFHDDLLISQCYFDGNGHLGRDPTGGTLITAHNAYLQLASRPATAWGNFSRNPAGHGIMARCGGVQAFNVYTSNPIAALLFNVGGTYRCNVVEKPVDGIGQGTWAPLASGGTATFTNGSTAVTGVGTHFTTDLIPVQPQTTTGATAPAVRPHSYLEATAVASVASDTSLTLATPYQGPTVGPCPFWSAAWAAALGTATFTNGSTTVASVSGTNFTAEFPADTNHFVSPADGSSPLVPYRVSAVTSSTLTLAVPFAGTTGTYTLNKASLGGLYPAQTNTGYNGNATFTNGSPTVTSVATGSGNSLPALFTKTTAAGQVVRPQVYQTAWRVARVVDDTHLVLATPFAGLTQTTPVDTMTLTKGVSGQDVGYGLQAISEVGTNYHTAQVLGVLFERNLFCNYGVNGPSQPTMIDVSTSPVLPVAGIIERNNTAVGPGRFWSVSNPLPAPTTKTQFARSNDIVATSRLNETTVTFANVGVPAVADYAWYSSDRNVIIAAGLGATPCYEGSVAGTKSLAQWEADTASEANSIATVPTWTGTGTTSPPTSDLGGYFGALGGRATEADYVGLLRARPVRAWGSAYDAAAVVAYYQGQYAPTNLPAVGTGPQGYYGAAPGVAPAPASQLPLLGFYADYAKNAENNLWHLGVAVAPPATIYLGLSQAAPDRGVVVRELTAASSPGYARVATTAATWSASAAGTVTNAAAVRFGPNPGSSPWTTAACLFAADAPSGGHVIWACRLAPDAGGVGQALAAGKALNFAPGSIAVRK
ncbi:MAG TPA: hypothetical protein VG406_14610 [Isosphaeraceae bacterium]|jgi:hypothetical protein|nr:hypothetical protein [Isosphaeraceae bacterium]